MSEGDKLENSGDEPKSEKLELGGDNAVDMKKLKKRRSKVDKCSAKSGKEQPQNEWLNDLLKTGDCERESPYCKVMGFLDDYKYYIGGAVVVGILTVVYLKKCRGTGGLKACPITGRVRK
ncbi:unnamed protein product [Caenorhabditis angaria]|uniref:Uncharacterized protein n=1 Tax=Caenorhabditis angaria TaxID=860376 RepID=A0A9P1IKE5_9PELO|nr:unnamed protein product [Caenorhabditis angaria]